MRRIGCIAVVALGLVSEVLAAGGSRMLAAGRGQPTSDRARQEREATAVARTITASAQALSDFPRTRNTGSVLSFYSKDYVGVENGEESSLDDERQILTELRDRIERGVSIEISNSARNIRVRVVGSIAWATYDYLFRIAVGDGDWDEESGKCTSVLEKSGTAWLLDHEHCSSLCPAETDEEGDEEEDPALNPERT